MFYMYTVKKKILHKHRFMHKDVGGFNVFFYYYMVKSHIN